MVIYDQTLNMFQQKMETIQYNAAVTITCALRGSYREKLYQGLDLETLQQRRILFIYLFIFYLFNVGNKNIQLKVYRKNSFFIKRKC